MKFQDFLRSRKTRWILPTAAAAVIAVVAVSAVMNNAAAAAAASQQQIVSKDVQVQKGDITVGVTETGAASLDSQTVTSDLTGAVIDQVLVKAGQSVKKGDAIVTLTRESVDTLIETAQLSYDQAEIKLKQAQASQATGSANAKTAYNTSKSKGTNAQATYNDTVNSLKDAVTSATNAYNNSVGTINYYKKLLDGLDTSQLQSQKEAADAALAAADPSDPNYDTLKANAQTADTNYSNYTAMVAQQQQLQGLKDKLTAAQNAVTSGTASAQSQLENDKTTGSSASTVYNNTLESLQTDVDSAQLQMTTAKEALDKLTPYKADPTIYSTYSGLIESVNYSAGATIAANSTAIAAIANNQVAYMLVSVTQDDIGNLSVGQEASVTLSAFQDTKFTGKIDSITITPARSASSTVSYSVTVKLDGDVSKIYEGMTGDVTFVTKQVKDVLYISNKAVTTVDGKQYVNVKDANGKISKVQVTTGFSDGQNVEIKSGLTQGQTVVIQSQAVTQK